MKKSIKYTILILLLSLLFGCSEGISPEQTAAPASVTHTPVRSTPTGTVSTSTAAPSTSLTTPIPNENGLTIEENEIIGQAELEPLTFQPLHGSQQAVLERHTEEKEEPYSFGMNFSAASEDHNYEAFENADNEGGITVSLKQNDETIFQVDAGHVSPISALRGLWIEDGQWVLEIAYITIIDENDVNYINAVGKVYQDGVCLNEQYGYEEMFGYQLLDGKPFYFYKKDGQIRLFYNNEDLSIWYDEVTHYQCCSGSILNPVAAGNWVGFWGIRNEVWYYTEIGRY